jgi:anaerobic ribonucleoside-triphosphate reductase activating protein
MIRFESTMITFTEVPDEIALCINCTCCPLRCKGCFEPWLRENSGDLLKIDTLHQLLWNNQHITCVCFMGGINDYSSLAELMKEVKDWGLKVAIYSGHDFISAEIEEYVDYYKIGPYIPEFGPLNLKNTNQKFYKKENNQ